MDKKGDKDKRRKREKGGLWKEARGRGMMGGPSQLSPRNRSEPELKTSAPCSAKLPGYWLLRVLWLRALYTSMSRSLTYWISRSTDSALSLSSRFRASSP